MNCVLLSPVDWKLVSSFHCQYLKFIASDYISLLLWFLLHVVTTVFLYSYRYWEEVHEVVLVFQKSSARVFVLCFCIDTTNPCLSRYDLH